MAGKVSPSGGASGFEEIPTARYEVQSVSSDGIDISDIIAKIWRRRGVVFAGLLVSVLLGLAASLVAYQRSSSASFVEYYISLAQINDSQYPNGTEFSPQDLISPEVIERLAGEIGIEDPAKLRQAISVEFNNPASAGVTAKYRVRLSARGLSATEIDTINQQFTEELSRVTSASLRLALSPASLGIDANLARQALVQIPNIWSEVYTSNFRILNDKRITSIRVDFSEPLSTPIGSIDADRKVDTLQEGLTILDEDNRLSALVAPNGISAADLMHEVQGFREIFLSPILASSLSGDDFLTRFYISTFRLEIEEINTSLETINETVADLQSLIDRQQTIASSDIQSSNNTSLDIDGSALASIVALANQASLSDYLTRLFEQRRALVKKKSELTTRIRRASGSVEIDEAFIEQAETQLRDYFGTYNNLVARARDIVRAESAELYRPASAPAVRQQGFARPAALMMALMLFVGLASSLLIAILLPSKSRRRVT